MKRRLRRPTSNPAPWAWVPTLYFAEGIPYVVVMAIAVLMYKRLGLSNAHITLYTSWLYLPWVIKPFWSPLVDRYGSKRQWILIMQLLIGASLGGIAFTLPLPGHIQWTLTFFWLMAFSSATHDIAADGFYLLALDPHRQALYVGIRSTFYRIATIAGQGLLIMFAGVMEVYTRQPARAWALTFYLAAAAFLLLAAYHRLILPAPPSDRPAADAPHRPATAGIFAAYLTFFRKPQLPTALAFILLYRLPEAMLAKVAPLFLSDTQAAGGLAMSTSEIGLVQGTLGVIGLTLGGILGGIAVAQGGFRRWLWPMVAAITLPDALYILLAYFQPTGLAATAISLFVEQFGYGFGFTAYMLFLLHYSKGPSSTAHYAFCTGLMALGMMLPGMFAGLLQERVGYLNFFIITTALTLITFIVAARIKVDADFGKKTHPASSH